MDLFLYFYYLVQCQHGQHPLLQQPDQQLQLQHQQPNQQHRFQLLLLHQLLALQWLNQGIYGDFFGEIRTIAILPFSISTRFYVEYPIKICFFLFYPTKKKPTINVPTNGSYRWWCCCRKCNCKYIISINLTPYKIQKFPPYKTKIGFFNEQFSRFLFNKTGSYRWSCYDWYVLGW